VDATHYGLDGREPEQNSNYFFPTDFYIDHPMYLSVSYVINPMYFVYASPNVVDGLLHNIPNVFHCILVDSPNVLHPMYRTVNYAIHPMSFIMLSFVPSSLSRFSLAS
jgi:hypothetical protein